MVWLVAQLFWFSPRIVVSRQTTWLTAPLANDGLPDITAYHLARSSEGVTVENNGAIPLLQAMWPAHLDSAQQQRIATELGMPLPVAKGLCNPESDKRLVHAVQALLGDPESEDDEENYLGLDLLSIAGEAPWRRHDSPPLAKWIDDHAHQYKLLHEAVARPRFFAPSPTHLLTPEECQALVHLAAEQAMQEAGECLKLRCMLRVGEGDYDGAWEDARAVGELARRVPRGSLVADVISFQLERDGNQLVLAILADKELPLELAREILNTYRQRNDRAIVADTIDRYERLVYVSIVFTLAGARPFDLEGELDTSMFVNVGLFRRGVDWNVVLRRGNEWFDRVAFAMRVARPRERKLAVEKVEQQRNALDGSAGSVIGNALSRSTRSEKAADICVRSLLPSPSEALANEEGVNADLLLHRVAAALAHYRREHGEYPASIGDLVPALLPEMPLDPYNAPLIYSRSREGYRLHSTGLNGIDEQGSNERLRIYQGYQVRGDESRVRDLLGLPPYDKSADSSAPAGQRLKDQIPPGADDWSLRLPLPKPQLPLPGDPSAQGTGERDEV
jgi:hypothetical protein